ncbi:MAG: 50S ribosomal protein L22 [Candidatus Omnitrophica bacterium CG12_big_fil_rev_8_21_14_0_65_43_15]|uniref:Large ribosomal subunit protein uL22 n=1 Tax=Candidatus Taenaricola geysiri TaxID=1974752 RepID=A0A2J0LJV8_9BACT|nr:MAG: 50S ribosomal protein L22 [Candidatus Omnitrophica bacterium CG1_02_43_210]PIR66052.1 MAG: 50S ribosomal protein L22 [Candidatus Omnitrophica bacterium CG10_big_fil_rev_8_21_14_0_10_43_8]PIW65883.1 MAG: 50S ribosomal protein L22 [Candidatus Omnitrophica bacterium CG12_big_fil_rev_8_21_14_0_65_43_15]PIY84823.1 MAG: 50S ribosomal protein L22 [Candidatus Omnitrophica bacterium CG_4_10_14_0_8_um_filter_43_18]PJC45844.1 MAG: 50S ribosomal protein L22 [Candidatus Omnitrophica bacterium CG_4_9
MIARSIARYVRVSPRKTRYVLDIIRGQGVDNAFSILDNTNKGAVFFIKQALKSALDSAVKKTKGSADASNLYISKATADGGPMQKRWRAASMGRATPILKRTSHILIELDMAAGAEKKAAKTTTTTTTKKKQAKAKTASKR